jgi:hypothetical protein
MMQKLCKHIKDAEFLDSATRQKIEAELAAEENNDVTETSVKSDDGDDSRMENDDEDNHVAKAAIVVSPIYW